MFRNLLIICAACMLPAMAFGQLSDDGKPVKVITDADISGTVTFSSDTVYNLDGFVFVEDGEVLNIDAGTIIKANTGQGVDASALIVAQGGTINAVGNANQPIVFTSILDDLDDNADVPAGNAGRGLWGGVLILGYATMNTTAGSDNVEGLPASANTLYGGSDDADNSGTLQYVSIRHGGSVLGTANEINGLTLGAVGSGTTIDHIEIFQNLDDGIEFFGGTVNVTHAIVAFCADDSYDVDEGYSGAGQFWFTIQDTEASDQGGEHDGGTTPEDGTPYATPLISNATYLGAGHKTITGVNPGCFNIRDNCSPAYYNSIFSDHAGAALKIEDLASGEDSRARLEAGDLVFQNNAWGYFQSGSNTLDMATGQTWTETLFTDGSFENWITDPGIFVTRTPTMDNDPRPSYPASLPNWTDPTAYNPPSKPGQGSNFVGFFEEVDYAGAFDPNATISELWISNWTAFDFYGYLGENEGQCGGITDNGKPVKTITSADIVDTTIFSYDTVYNLDGFVFVDSGEVLEIEAGTIIKANTGQGVDASALIVSRGGKIYAQGTAECPIIFTSILDDIDDVSDVPYGDAGRGLWGGLLILGRATMNTTAGSDNVEGLPASAGTLYGGSDDDDNSGAMHYVSIRHGGSVLGTANEINGLTLGAVGRGTRLDHIEIFQNLDDGIEWFGGTVNLTHAIVAFCADDGYDFDEGFSGGGQYWFTIMDTISAGQSGEHDGGTTPEDGTPYATPLISNATYLGAGYQTLTGVNAGGFNVRDNCSPAYYNSIFSDHAGAGIKIEDLATGEDSRARLEAGDLVYQNNVWGLFSVGTATLDVASGQAWTETLFTTPAFDNDIVDPQIYVTRSATADNDPRPKMASLPSYTDPTVYNPPVKPGQGGRFVSFFDEVSYVGAFDPNVSIGDLWLANWTAFDQYGYLGENNGSAAGCCIGGTGNVNYDPGDNVDISDLTKMVNHLFVTFESLDCPGEANTNGDAGCNIDISDLTKLVNHLFITFEPLADCLPQCQTPAP